jgi:hypothetical protein
MLLGQHLLYSIVLEVVKDLHLNLLNSLSNKKTFRVYIADGRELLLRLRFLSLWLKEELGHDEESREKERACSLTNFSLVEEYERRNDREMLSLNTTIETASPDTANLPLFAPINPSCDVPAAVLFLGSGKYNRAPLHPFQYREAGKEVEVVFERNTAHLCSWEKAEHLIQRRLSLGKNINWFNLAQVECGRAVLINGVFRIELGLRRFRGSLKLDVYNFDDFVSGKKTVALCGMRPTFSEVFNAFYKGHEAFRKSLFVSQINNSPDNLNWFRSKPFVDHLCFLNELRHSNEALRCTMQTSLTSLSLKKAKRILVEQVSQSLKVLDVKRTGGDQSLGCICFDYWCRSPYIGKVRVYILRNSFMPEKYTLKCLSIPGSLTGAKESVENITSALADLELIEVLRQFVFNVGITTVSRVWSELCRIFPERLSHDSEFCIRFDLLGGCEFLLEFNPWTGIFAFRVDNIVCVKKDLGTYRKLASEWSRQISKISSISPVNSISSILRKAFHSN